MRRAEQTIATGLPFVWLGLVVDISVIVRPLRFMAPAITRQVGPGIGRLVFRALNAAELAIACVLPVVSCDGHPIGRWRSSERSSRRSTAGRFA